MGLSKNGRRRDSESLSNVRREDFCTRNGQFPQDKIKLQQRQTHPSRYIVTLSSNPSTEYRYILSVRRSRRNQHNLNKTKEGKNILWI